MILWLYENAFPGSPHTLLPIPFPGPFLQPAFWHGDGNQLEDTPEKSWEYKQVAYIGGPQTQFSPFLYVYILGYVLSTTVEILLREMD